ncbi:MAG: nitroreductase family protein [Halothiobacillus sp.]
MSFIEFIHQRHSTPPKHLVAPAPSVDELTIIINAAESAPDHANLKPWRFLVIDTEQRAALGELLVQALTRKDPHTRHALLERERERALRPPMLIAAIARITPNHQKTPDIEQFLAAAAATEHVMLAANSLGYGTIWLTGSRVYDRYVMTGLGLHTDEHLIGLINIGSIAPDAPPKQPNRRSVTVAYWQG